MRHQQQHNDGARVQDALLQLSLSHAHTHTPTLSLACFLPELICIILIWHFWPRRQAPVAVISKHSHGDTFRLHAICINCSVPTSPLSVSLPPTLCICLFLLLLLLSFAVSLNYCHLISAITTHFCATICPLSCPASSLSLALSVPQFA